MRAPPLCWLLCLTACAVRPDGEEEAREHAARAGQAYATPFARRQLPALHADSPLADFIAHAEAAHGGLEASWFRWLAALEQVPQDATQSTTAMVGIEHRLDGGPALDRTGLALANDAMNNLVLPGRLGSRGEAALARARVAAADFDRDHARLRREVTEAFLALAQRDAEIALLDRLRVVLAANVPSVAARVRAGGAGQPMLLEAEVALARVDAELARLRQGRAGIVAALRARVGAREEFPDPRPELPAVVALSAGELEELDQVLARSPDVEVRRRELIAARAEVVVREWERTPGFSLSGLLMGDGVATIGGMFTLPFLRGTAIEAAVRQAEAEVRAAEALRRQAGSDAVAVVCAEVAALQAVEAETAVLEGELLPRLRQAADVARSTWSAGRGALADWAVALAAAIEVERAVIRLRAEHAVGRARLEEQLGAAS